MSGSVAGLFMERKSRVPLFYFCFSRFFLRRYAARQARPGPRPGLRRPAALGVRGPPEPSPPRAHSPARNETGLPTDAFDKAKTRVNHRCSSVVLRPLWSGQPTIPTASAEFMQACRNLTIPLAFLFPPSVNDYKF